MLTGRFSRCFVFLTLISFLGAQSAHALKPAEIAGVMTRWQTSSPTACEQTYDGAADEPDCPKSLMFTITPDLMGLTLQNWVNALTAAGVNTGIIYVEPGYRLATGPTISEANWEAYNQYIYLPPATLMDSQKIIILEVGEAISQKQYTVAQRNYAILTFLNQLQQAFPATAPIKFILDERVWFISHLNANGKPIPLSQDKVFAFEQDYANDIAGLAQAATQQHVDHWLAGARLSEYASKDWNLMGPVMVDLASLINAKANNWLTSHLFIGAGGGWGQDFEGIDSMQCPTTTGWQFPACTGAFPFFQYMSQQARFFAFGDKFMEFGKPEEYTVNGDNSDLTYTYITGEIADFCQENTRDYVCTNPATPSVTDWQAFLEDNKDGLGFTDLIHLMKDNANEYPRLANVIFDGDNSDSTATMTLPPSINGFTALNDLFAQAMQGDFENVETGAAIHKRHLGSWTGKIFLNAFDATSSVPRPDFYDDPAFGMFDTNYNDFTFLPATAEIIPRAAGPANWRNWP